MGAKTNNMIALATAGLFVALGLPGAAQGQTVDPKAASFTRDLAPALEHRLTRMVDLDTFAQMHREANTIILDTRSAADFAQGHIYGAVNVPLSEMTLLNLADAVADRDTRILIYGDENIDEIAGRSDFTVSTLPINLLTFVSLHRYGYYEVYELNEATTFKDTRLDWVNEPHLLASLIEASFN